MSITEKRTGIWLFVYFVSLVSSIALSWLLIRAGHERVAKILFLWFPFITIVSVKLSEPVLRRYLESGEHGQMNVRKDAPQIINALFRLIPIMALSMVGYAYVHLTKHGSV